MGDRDIRLAHLRGDAAESGAAGVSLFLISVWVIRLADRVFCHRCLKPLVLGRKFCDAGDGSTAVFEDVGEEIEMGPSALNLPD